ncbi:MAG: hypothetical protein QM330_09390 [Acidobacteriota bacterium]|jgi:hypothetical protein|nr:hypothetical protein [Acidobacteriota bacterium]NLT33057.1 hypothetical protein [Acidobacteriota bacterium]
MMRTSVICVVVGMAALAAGAAPAPEWNPAAIRECDRACLVTIIDGYMDAVYRGDPRAVPPLAADVRMTENTGAMDVGEGVLWRSKVKPTGFLIHVADPVAGQVALQARLEIEGQHALAAVRLKVDRGKIQEIEHLYVRNSRFEKSIDDAALALLTTPLPILTDDVPPARRTPRDILYRAANSYFDALEGDNGKIGAFADDCVRHENGYRTVNHPPPGGRMMPSPVIPTDPEMLKFSMMTCSEQIDTGTFAYMKRIRPRRVLILDEQKGLAASFPLFIHDGTSRKAAPGAPPGMLQNLVTMETFAIRDGLIRHVEAFPFVTLPYGLGNGWTPGSGR